MSKGGEFERNISKFLTKWLTGSEKPYMFWRQDASGGLATVHSENTHLTGDITYLRPEAKFFCDIFSIECKTGYPKTSFWQHFNKTKFNIEDFWIQALTDAKKSDKYPLLIYRKKGRKEIIGINNHIRDIFWRELIELNGIAIRFSARTYDRTDINHVYLTTCNFYDMKDFFERIKPDDIKRLLESKK
jgi:hypothetical protein